MNVRGIAITSTPRFAYAPDGEGAGGGNGASDGGGGGGADPNANAGGDQRVPNGNGGPDWAAFTGAIDKLNESLGGRLDTLKSTVENVATEPEPDIDLDTLTNAQLAVHIQGQVAKSVAEVIREQLAPIQTQLSSLQTNTALDTARKEIADLESKNKDFGDWKPDMIALAKSDPRYQALSVGDLYALVKSRDAGKAATLAAKYNPPQPPKPAPFSMPATGARGATAPKVMTTQEAGRAAYLEVMERHPGVLAALQE